MLSVHDRQALARIEADLAAEQPDLARMLARFDQWAPPRRRGLARHRFLVWMAVVGAIALALAFALHSAAVLVLGILLLAVSVFDAAVLWVLAQVRRHVRRPAARSAHPTRR
ncbi:DUF3040 domain-containing protein [Streptacidiphilus carbonis]|jgi:uncharacterized membrane protein|uniref:DUF3040 domain-containing protein n=1 Tax=Streptacidiphilus carbonis TaxID=105422 RepID=UPI0005A7CD25|nr:DUF3040 domain-containing protein [Streptacidiphilus carbonis]